MKKIKHLLRVFLGTSEEENLVKKGFVTGAGAGIYWLFDYLLVPITTGVVALLLFLGLNWIEIFLLLWLGNIFLSWAIIRASDSLKIDFTLFAGYSRLLPAFSVKRSIYRVLAAILTAPVLMLIIIWQGAAPVIIFLKEHRHLSKWLTALLLIAVSAVQMAVWTKLYILGLDSLSDLAKYYLKN